MAFLGSRRGSALEAYRGGRRAAHGYIPVPDEPSARSAQLARDKPDAYGHEDTSLRTLGGEAGVRALVDHFYDAMETRPEARHIRSLHPADLTLAREKLAAFLTGWLGGPRRYRERWGPIRIPAAHAHVPITPADRDAWLACMRIAIDRMDVPDDFRTYFLREIARPAQGCVNREA